MQFACSLRPPTSVSVETMSACSDADNLEGSGPVTDMNKSRGHKTKVKALRLMIMLAMAVIDESDDTEGTRLQDKVAECVRCQR